MAFDWYNECDVAAISHSDGQLWGLETMAANQALATRSSALMIRTLQIIYNRFYNGNARSTLDTLDAAQVIRFLNEKVKIEPSQEIYGDLIVRISKLKTKTIEPIFIERYCLAKLSDAILAEYSVNVAEAYTLAYVSLNKPTDIGGMYFKLGTSGLLGTTMIDGERITDIEAVAKFVVSSLHKAGLLIISDRRWLKPGVNFILTN